MSVQICFTCQICGNSQKISEYETRHLFPICDDCKEVLGKLVKREKEPTADVVPKEKYDRLLENAMILADAVQKYQKMFEEEVEE